MMSPQSVHEGDGKSLLCGNYSSVKHVGKLEVNYQIVEMEAFELITDDFRPLLVEENDQPSNKPGMSDLSPFDDDVNLADTREAWVSEYLQKA